jgi:hypothetical protein
MCRAQRRAERARTSDKADRVADGRAASVPLPWRVGTPKVRGQGNNREMMVLVIDSRTRHRELKNLKRIGGSQYAQGG